MPKSASGSSLFARFFHFFSPGDKPFPHHRRLPSQQLILFGHQPALFLDQFGLFMDEPLLFLDQVLLVGNHLGMRKDDVLG